MEKEQKDNSFMMKLATLIVDKRKGFYLVFILLIIFSLISMNKVKVNNDLTTYLSDDTETRQGMDLMNAQFITYGTARIMVCNVTFEEAEALAGRIEEMEGVSMLDCLRLPLTGRPSRKAPRHIWRRCWSPCQIMMCIIPRTSVRRSGTRRIWIRTWS